MSERTETLSYLAGVIDSDGCINIQKRKAGKWAANYQPRVTVKQVMPEAVELAKVTLGGSSWLSAPSSQRARRLYVWNIHSHAACTALDELLPYLRLKAPQARNAIAVGEVNRRLGRRKFDVPAVVPGEPMLTLAEVVERSGRSYETVTQAIRAGTIPFVRHPRAGSKPSVFVPESFLPIWASRGDSPKRNPAVTAELEALYLRGKELNRVGA